MTALAVEACSVVTAVLVVVETEVLTRSFEVPRRYPVPAPTMRTIANSAVATSPLIKVNQALERLDLRLMTRTVRQVSTLSVALSLHDASGESPCRTTIELPDVPAELPPGE